MEKFRINMVGGPFYHSFSSNDSENIYVEWIKNTYESNYSIYLDDSLTLCPLKDKINFGWLYEAKTINKNIYDWAEKNTDILKKNFLKVFTHDLELSKKSDIFQLTLTGAKSYFKKEECDLYEKTKLISMVASNKLFCYEHFYRQEIIRKFYGRLDLYGRGHNEIKNKLDGLKDYCFSISMENGTYPNMFSEKITDCFVTGTIPIYYGMKDIGKFFNMDGIIVLDDKFKIEDLSFELYYSKYEAVKENFEIAMNILSSEDYLYLNFLKKFDEDLNS
jgi:hypothetical protein